VQHIYGVNPILEALKSKNDTIKKIIVTIRKKGRVIQTIMALAAERHIPVEFIERNFIDKMTGCKNHQGIVAFCEGFMYASLHEVINRSQMKSGTVLILDGITDPQNLGALIRTAHCLGVAVVIIPDNRAASVTAAVIKASAGAAQWLPVVRTTNLSRTIEYLKERGFWIYGADAHEGRPAQEFDDSGPVGLVVGSEGRGLRSSIKKKCDFFLSVPMVGMINSLNVTVATGIILYEMLKIREKGK
jgi:23S rRNA (guanosine2251-2'-O)-methyltransferase